MKTRESSNEDEALRKVLREWKTDVPPPPNFRANVWHRIEQTKGHSGAFAWSRVAQWVSTAFPRPALGFSYCALLLAIGGTAGWAQARHETARVRGELGGQYIRMLDPYQAPLR